ncbi:hypothetical protein Poli38472_008273 [Pythium oligandrum]|uniref:Calcineurin-like phosphoesterase domain-containing protein n=1 Tax=Pythium oligandrum TaxID=41045 RepID=A0A8K1CL48_PYTOL|nr:hypothetical protein Poli38472_008273 [Pythium oligandrum]|eukprot:TMW65631.1 hypothetical protein Poli38472_008273 [Pythium oligandrum]
MPESLKEGSPGRRLRRQEEASSATNGLTFKIVQLADLHISGDPTAECRDPPIEFQNVTVNCTEAITTVFVNSILDMENPDFFVFSGDTVHVPDATLRSAAIETAFLVVEARGIPYAVIMGNHDDDYGFPRQDIMSRIYARNLSYVESGPNHIQGVGNYALAVKAPSDGPWGKQGEPVFRMYFLDSNNLPDEAKYPTIQSEYDWIRPQQIEYYRQLSLSNRVTPTPIPAIIFYHIPVPEYANVSRRSGARGEDIHSPKFNSHLLSTLVELGEVKATFAGPDHTNEFCAKVHDIQLCYGGRTGFGLAYSAPGLLVVLACLNGVSIRKIAVV